MWAWVGDIGGSRRVRAPGPLLELRRLEPAHQLAGVDAEHVGQAQDVVQPDVPLPALNLPDVAPVHGRVVGQLLLALAEFLPAGTYAFPEHLGRIRDGLLCHSSLKLICLRTKGPETKSLRTIYPMTMCPDTLKAHGWHTR